MDASQPIDVWPSLTDLLPLFDCYRNHQCVALAVSGGPDSVALMHLSGMWRDAIGRPAPTFIVLTLDHGLRAAAAGEANTVAAAAAALGLPVRILTRAAAPRQGGLQEQARNDRYRLLADAARTAGATAIATGHTAEDQAETLLMRLARGSGVDGLSAMSAISCYQDLSLLRPLLGVAKSQLKDFLARHHVPWIEDPSNTDKSFERPRLRILMPQLAAAGLTAKALGRSTTRLARARQALEAARREADQRLTSVRSEGYVSIDRAGFEALPEEIRLRVLQHWIGLIGNPCTPAPMAKLERIVAASSALERYRSSIHYCLVSGTRERILISREPGRAGLPIETLQPGGMLVWDHRFRITLPTDAIGAVVVRALQRADLVRDLAGLARKPSVPRAALFASPSAWRAETLIACPALGVMAEPLTFDLALPDPKAISAAGMV